MPVRSGIRTHAHIRGPEYSTLQQGKAILESGALDRSAILTCLELRNNCTVHEQYAFLTMANSKLIIQPESSVEIIQ
ncbi:hypothetical protein CDAR_389751 [Caerostris darwini]|uniref:Uncharacterized protein n=1 Tax=Caerostris darwini TaxID=1538125 RepID=A0AAV4P4X9_9ARAC|nr:hypothetical protein CDAR_389751 [Caerostris darwini]